jgi:hypothetical protein
MDFCVFDAPGGQAGNPDSPPAVRLESANSVLFIGRELA